MTGVLKKNYVVAKETFFELYYIPSYQFHLVLLPFHYHSYSYPLTHVVLMLNHSTLTTDTVLPG